MRWMSWMCVAMATAAFAVPAAPAKRGPIELWLTASVEITAEGRIGSLEWKDRRTGIDVVTSRLEPKIRAWRFEPGAIDGVPQTTRTHLTVQVIGEDRSGGSVALRFGRISTGARAFEIPPPRYPLDAIKAGTSASFVGVVEVGETSRVTSIELAWLDGKARHVPQFEQAARAALQSARFEPERVGGRVVPAQVSIPIDFCVEQGCNRLEQRRAAATARGEPPLRPFEVVALDSAVTLLTAVEGDAI